MKTKDESKNSSDTVESKFECPHCEFVSTSKQGLKVHMTRKHTKYTKDNRPNKCEVCDAHFMRYLGKPMYDESVEKAILAHSYKCSSYLKYKCDECEFWGKNILSMKVHVQKHHEEKTTCGLCDYVADDIETLETHQFTCEIFKCFNCHKKFTNLAALKKHVSEDHEEKSTWIAHSKKDRKNSDYYKSDDHKFKDLFNKQN